MSKEIDNKNMINQTAWILNYQPKIEHQHIYVGGKEVKGEEKPFIPCELKFFD